MLPHKGEIMGWGKDPGERRRVSILGWMLTSPFVHGMSVCELEKSAHSSRHIALIFQKSVIINVQISGVYDVTGASLDVTPWCGA